MWSGRPLLLENLLCACPAVGPIRPHSLNTLPSASLPALLTLLSTGQACPTSRPIYARTISLSGPFLPRPVHDSFLSTSMCGPNATSLLKPPPPRTHSSQQQSHAAPPTSPQLHCFLCVERRAICPQCFIFLCSTLSWAFSLSSGVWSCCPTAVSPGPVAIVSGRQVFSACSGWVCGLSCVPL